MPMAPIGGGGTKTCRYRSVTSYSVTDFIQSRVQRLTERFTYLWSVRLCINNAFMTMIDTADLLETNYFGYKFSNIFVNFRLILLFSHRVNIVLNRTVLPPHSCFCCKMLPFKVTLKIQQLFCFSACRSTKFDKFVSNEMWSWQ